MISILVTGANGFVGPYLLRALEKSLNKECVIHACYFDKNSEYADTERVKWHPLDITNQQEVVSLVRNILPDYLIHLAAISHVPTADAAIQKTWQVNVMGSIYLFEAIHDFCSKCCSIFVSSSEVYGESFKETEKVTEDSCLQPLNVYAASKAAIDLLARQMASNETKIIRLRPFNHVGPGQTEDFVLPAFAAQIARIEAGHQEPVLKVGNLSAVRDFLDVRDVVDAYVCVLNNFDKLQNGAAYNISSEKGYKIEELLEKLCQIADCEVKIVKDPARLRKVEIASAVGSSERLQTSLGWKPRYKMEQTLNEILEEWRAKYAD